MSDEFTQNLPSMLAPHLDTDGSFCLYSEFDPYFGPFSQSLWIRHNTAVHALARGGSDELYSKLQRKTMVELFRRRLCKFFRRYNHLYNVTSPPEPQGAKHSKDKAKYLLCLRLAATFM